MKSRAETWFIRIVLLIPLICFALVVAGFTDVQASPGDNHNYTFPGLYYENGTVCTDPAFVNVSVIFPSAPSNSFGVSGTSPTAYDYYEKPLRMSWGFGTITRYWYILDDEETIYPFQPEASYAVYDFSFHDYAGIIGTQDTYLEALRYVNGTQYIVERAQIFNSESETNLALVQYQLYDIRLRLSDGSYYDLGDFIAGDSDPPIYSLTGIEWDDQFQVVADYIHIEATRPNSTHIRFEYNSSLTTYSTVNVSMSITYRNGTVIFTNFTVGENVAFTWYNAVNVTDYRVNASIYHGYYGWINYGVILSGIWEPPDPPNFDDIGLPLALVSAFIVLIVLGSVSRLSASLGIFVGTVVGIGLNNLGWWVMPEIIQASGIILAILISLSGRDSK